MSENKHTPEPWSIDPDDRPNMHWNNHIVSDENPNIAICFMAHDGTEQNECGEANARRIVACVNACAGIPTELLNDSKCWAEAGIETATSLREQIATLRKQRDLAVEALEDVNECFDAAEFEGLSDRIREANVECGSLADLVMRRLSPALSTVEHAISTIKESEGK